MSLLNVSDLRVTVADREILKGVNLKVNPGEIHAIMGPNGSGKSTLTNTIAGQEGYSVTSGDLQLNGTSLLELEPEERSYAGLFLAFQYPVEIPGVTNLEFLKTAVDSHRKQQGDSAQPTVEFIKRMRSIVSELDFNPEFLKRGVNESFSGGEKKRNEILQMLSLNPKVALLDETDSGLDIDSLQVVAKGINKFRSSHNAVVLVTHYQRLLNHVVPDYVHVLLNGSIVKTGDASLAHELERHGYTWLTQDTKP